MYDGFKADIAAQGLRVPIWTFRGQIIDGRNRYRACRELGIPPLLQEWGGEGSLVEFILSLNRHRRHDTKGQLAMTAAKIANLGVGRPQQKAQICAITQREAAEGMGISRREVQKADALIRKGKPCLRDAVARGVLDLDPALEIAGLDAREQNELESGGAKAVTRKASEIRRVRTGRKNDDQGAEVRVPTATMISATPTVGLVPANMRPEEYPIRAKLADPSRFELQVDSWRSPNDLLARNGVAPFASDDPWFVVGRYGSDFDPIDDAKMTAPPEDWPLCSACKGSGKGRKRSEGWVDCRGKGFLVKRVPLACDRPREDPPGEITRGGGVPEAGDGPDRTGRGRRKTGRNRLRLPAFNEEEAP